MPDEPDNEGEPGLPPHPLDRVWFHPSELGASSHPIPTTRRRHDWGVAAIGVVCGIVVTVGVLAATGALGSGSSSAGGSAGLTPVFARLQNDRAADLVAGAAASVVAVRVGDAADTVGSGVAFGSDRIVTSAALVAGATAVSITTSRGRVVPATVVGVDAETDVALLRADGSHLPAAHLGSADRLAVGSWVLALGSSGGERRWASQGVVSGLGVAVARIDGTTMPGLVATDVATSDEVGGGPLIDDDGAVVAILSRAAPGHAMPVDVVREVTDQLSANGRVRHAWLGVDAVSAEMRPGGGAIVQVVTLGGPAEAAGLVPGDVITGFGDDRISDLADLLAAVVHRRPGDPVELTIWRGDHRSQRSATLAERPQTAAP